jgi:transposase-like protein
MPSRSSKTSERWTPEHAASLLAEAERSGLSDRAFAKRRGIDPQRLWWWRKRLDKTRTKKAEVGFVELAVRSPATPMPTAPMPTAPMPTAPMSAGRIEILLGNGRVVATPVDVDLVVLARLLDAVEGRRC